jgi:hypothetical protein
MATRTPKGRPHRGWVLVLGLLCAWCGSRPVLSAASVPGGELDSLPPLRPPGESSFSPEALAVDALGRLFACDRAAGQIVRFTPEGACTRFGVGDQGGMRYANLTNLFAQWGPDLFALDASAATLYQFDLNGRLLRSISYREGLEAARLGSMQPSDFALTRTGELLLLDRSGGHVLLFDRFGSFLTDWASGAVGDERPQSPVRMAQDEQGQVFLLDPPWVRRFSRQGASRPAWRYAEGLGKTGGVPLLTVAPWGPVVVAGRDGAWIRLFDADGRLLLDWRNPSPSRDRNSDLAAGPDSTLYLSSSSLGEVRRWRWRPSQDGGAGDQ